MDFHQTSDSSINSRVISAMFDTAGAARQAVDDLVAAGIPRAHITQTDADTAGEPVTATAPAGAHKGFWESLKDLFMPDDDRALYDEGLRRGGILVAVHVDEANYTRALDILDTDGAIDLDERGAQWRGEGWTGLDARTSDGTAGALAGMPGGQSVSDVVPPASASVAAASGGMASGAAGPGTATPSAPDGIASSPSRAATGSADAQPPIGQRDATPGRTRLRSYTLDPSARSSAGAPSSTGSFIDGAAIAEHMAVISSDGQTIGTVDHLDGPDRIKLARSTSPDGRHHIVPFTWIDHVDQHVHLKRSLAEIRADASTST